MKLHTTLCDLLGIEYPILQAGMGGVAGPELVAEVARAGGLGILAGLNLGPDELRARIQKVRQLTDRPFGVNLWLHDELRPPVDPAKVPEITVTSVQSTLNRFRQRLGLTATLARPSPVPDVIGPCFEVCMEEQPAVFSSAVGAPTPVMVQRCHERGIRVVAMVTTVNEARQAEAAGSDVIVAQGGEAGGHRSTGSKPARPEGVSVGAMALVPQVVDAVRVPVVAAGGMADGRGLVAALALGASGVLLGTRFAATRESAAAEFRKKAILEAASEATVMSVSVSGLWARYLRCAYITEYDASGAPVLPALLQTSAAQDIFAAATQQQDTDYVPMATGQSVGLIHDLPGAAEVVEAVVREARTVLAALASRVRVD